MQIDKKKMGLAMARKCMEVSDVAKGVDMPIQTVKKAYSGARVRVSTVGKIARALGVDVLDILDDTEGGERE